MAVEQKDGVNGVVSQYGREVRTGNRSNFERTRAKRPKIETGPKPPFQPEERATYTDHSAYRYKLEQMGIRMSTDHLPDSAQNEISINMKSYRDRVEGRNIIPAKVFEERRERRKVLAGA